MSDNKLVSVMKERKNAPARLSGPSGRSEKEPNSDEEKPHTGGASWLPG